MNDCIWTKRINAYHDDEVSAQERRDIEAHLPLCRTCRAELQSLRLISHSLGRITPPEFTASFKQRLHAATDRAQLRVMGRLTGALGALAASVAIVTVLWSNSASNTATAAGAEQWEQAAVQLTAADTTELTTAEWVLAGLSNGESDVD